MSVIKKILANWYYIFGLLIGLGLFYTGITRISLSRSLIIISDPEVAHFMGVGILYVQISLVILITLTIGITYSITKHKK